MGYLLTKNGKAVSKITGIAFFVFVVFFVYVSSNASEDILKEALNYIENGDLSPGLCDLISSSAPDDSLMVSSKAPSHLPDRSLSSTLDYIQYGNIDQSILEPLGTSTITQEINASLDLPLASPAFPKPATGYQSNSRLQHLVDYITYGSISFDLY